MLLPAFGSNGYFQSRASFSIPAALIAGIPILVSHRHLAAYDYIQPPALIFRNTSMSDAAAIAQYRQERTRRRQRASDSEWSEYHERMAKINDQMWMRIFG